MKTIIVLSVLVIITTPYCYSASLDHVEDKAETVHILIESKPNCNDSNKIQQSGGGAVYTRWGRTVCPDTEGTELVYKGLVSGVHYDKSGGGANYLCITEEPEYLSSTVPMFSPSNIPLSWLYATEYQIPGFSAHGRNAPCAVCYSSQRSSKLMIPGKTSCPTSWTEEYEGYLVTERESHKHSKVFECMDKDRETAPKSGGSLFALVAAECKANVGGIPNCPPYVANRPITCVVCTK